MEVNLELSDFLKYRGSYETSNCFKSTLLLVFDKSYHDNTNNENNSQSVIVFIIYLLPRNFKHGIGLSLHILYYSFIKVPYYIYIYIYVLN